MIQIQWLKSNFTILLEHRTQLDRGNRRAPFFLEDQRQERCADRAATSDCEGWKKAGFCLKHESLIYHCKKTCNLCSSGKLKKNRVQQRIAEAAILAIVEAIDDKVEQRMKL